jgi:glycosyltransferase involved in cell wall biosynthesis
MKLAVFSGQYFWFDGKHYSTDEAFVEFVTSFSSHFEKIVFCDALKEEKKMKAYVLDLKKTGVCPLPNFTVYSFWRNLLIIFPRIYRIIRNNIRNWDVVWLHAPHPISLIFAYICMKVHTPCFLFVRQNLRSYVGYRNRGAKRVLAVAVASVLEYIFRRLSRNMLTFTVGKEILNTYKKTGKRVYNIAVSLVSEKDILHTLFKRVPRESRQTKLLSVGRLEPEKGLTYLIQAVDELVANGKTNIILQLAGTGTEEGKLRQEVTDRGLAQNVHFVGYVRHGSQLLDLYKESDIYIQPSLTEGWPQTLFEAMACGVPVVATRVGGIPDLIRNGQNGLLIAPGSPREIGMAIERLTSDNELSGRLAKNGLALVREHTMESERQRILSHIEELVKA